MAYLLVVSLTEWKGLEEYVDGNGENKPNPCLAKHLYLLFLITRLFIIEGLGTVIAGFVAYLLLPGMFVAPEPQKKKMSESWSLLIAI